MAYALPRVLGGPHSALHGRWLGSPAQLDGDVQTWLAAVRAAGGSVSMPTAQSVNRLVQRLKGSGLWDKTYMLDCCCGDSLTAALVRVKVPTGVDRAYTNVNFVSGDYVERGSTGGLTGNGSSKYLNSLVNPVSLSYSQTSFGMWCYTRTTAAGGTSQVTMGSNNVGTGNQSTILGWVSSGSIEGGSIAGTNSASAEYAGRLTPSVAGFHGVTTNGSSTATYYLNGAAQANTRTQTSTFQNDAIGVHALRSSAAPASYCSRTLSTKLFTSGLSDAEAAQLNTFVSDFERELNRSV